MAGKKRASTSLTDTSPAAKKAKISKVPKQSRDNSTVATTEAPEPSRSGSGSGSDSESEADLSGSEEVAKILAGFSGSEDESEAEDGDSGIKIADLPAIPNVKLPESAIDEPGVCYIGRIPRGFYDRQMKAYFSQFGDVTRLRLARNKRTGKYRHHAWIEFASADVAEIVAKTMDKYLMFGHILQVKRIPAAEVHPELFKGAGKRFKTVPRNKIEGKALDRGAEKKVWEGRVQKEVRRRAKSARKAKEMGYEYVGAALKKPDGGDALKTVGANPESESASPAVKRNKTGKGKKASKPRV